MKSSRRKLAVFLLALLVLLTGSIGSALAQSQDSLRRVHEAARRQNLFIRAHTPSGVVQGRVPFVDEADVRVGTERVAYGSIAAIERQHREGGGARKGALAGGLALGTVGALMALTCDGCIEAFPLGVALGTGGGALVGALTGRPGTSSWERIWTAPGGVLASGDTLLVPLPEKPAPRADPQDAASDRPGR